MGTFGRLVFCAVRTHLVGKTKFFDRICTLFLSYEMLIDQLCVEHIAVGIAPAVVALDGDRVVIGDGRTARLLLCELFGQLERIFPAVFGDIINKAAAVVVGLDDGVEVAALALRAVQQVRKVAALDSEGEEAENLKKHFPGSEPFLENQKQTELKTADIGWGMILLILFVLEFIFAVLELRRMYYEYRIRKISDNGSLPSVEFLLLMIYKHLLILGIDMQPGFKSEQIQEKIRETLPEIPDGLYLRVNDLMEKYFYGGEPLEEYEIRLVHQFLLKLRDSRKKMGIFDRLRFRYCIFS